MSYFLNLKNGELSIDENRTTGAIVGMQTIIDSARNSEQLSTSLSDWIASQCATTLKSAKHMTFGSYEQIKDFVLSDSDFLYELFEQNLDSDLYLEYPDLRDLQRDLIEDIAEFHGICS